MKRHPSLHPLSHDHHHGLVQAKRLQENAPGAAAGFARVWREEIEPHFEREERLLLPHLPEDSPEAVRLRDEHRILRERAAGVADASPADLRETGRLLHDHIRWEERVLFPLLETMLPEETLAEIGAALTASEANPPG